MLTIKQKSTEWCFRSVEKLRNFVARNTSQAYECEHSTPLLARRTPSNQRFEWCSRSQHKHIIKKNPLNLYQRVLFSHLVAGCKLDIIFSISDHSSEESHLILNEYSCSNHFTKYISFLTA